jgi:uncharacterized protein (TIGR03382 family)
MSRGPAGVLLVAIALPAAAAVSLVQNGHVLGGTAASISYTLPDASVAGDWVLVAGGVAPPLAPVAVTDDHGNTYTLANSAGSNQFVFVYYAAHIDGGGPLTVTWRLDGGEESLSLAVAEFSGVSPTDGFAGSAAYQAPPQGQTATPDSGAVVASTAGCLLFGAMAHDGDVQSSPGGGFVLLDLVTDNAQSFNPLADEFLITGGPAAASATFGLAGIAYWGAVAVVLSPADGGGGGSDAGTPGETPDGGTARQGAVGWGCSASGNAAAAPVLLGAAAWLRRRRRRPD